MYFLQFFVIFGIACLRQINRLARRPTRHLARKTKDDYGIRPAALVRRGMPQRCRNQSAGRMSKASTWPNDMKIQTAMWRHFQSVVNETNMESASVPRPTRPSIQRPQIAAPASNVRRFSLANSGQNHHLDHAALSPRHQNNFRERPVHINICGYVYINMYSASRRWFLTKSSSLGRDFVKCFLQKRHPSFLKRVCTIASNAYVRLLRLGPVCTS